MSDNSFKKFTFKDFLAGRVPASDNSYDNSQYRKSNEEGKSRQGARVKVGGPKVGNANLEGANVGGANVGSANAENANAGSSALEESGANLNGESLGAENENTRSSSESRWEDEGGAPIMGRGARGPSAHNDESVSPFTEEEFDQLLKSIDALGNASEAPAAKKEVSAPDTIMAGMRDQMQSAMAQADQVLNAMKSGTYNKVNRVSDAANAEAFDRMAQERMMYEGSDREGGMPVVAKAAEQKPALQPTQKTKRTKQFFAANKPLTQKPRAPQRPRLIAIANQKGGVGKTTTAINLATALCAVGKRVLLMDLDPQGNASTGLGVRRSAIRTSVYDVLFEDADVIEASVSTRVPGLSVVPSSIHLSGAEIELVTADHRESRLKNALHRVLPYDYVIVDCPPSLNLLTLNALVAMDSLLVPLQCEFYALEGLSHLVKTVERVKKSFNPKLEIQGIALTMYDARNKLSAQVEADVREHFGDKVYKTVIPRNVRLSEAPSFGLPAIIYDMKCSGAQAYIKLAREVIKRETMIEMANEMSIDPAKVA